MAERRPVDPEFDREAYENADPEGEQAFAEEGFRDAPDGGPDFDAPGLESDPRPPGGHGQKVAGVPEARQREPNTPSEQHPDSPGYVLKGRGGAEKGDPAVGGTRPD